jgi:hypothetical protein
MQYALLFYNPPHTLIPAPEREAVLAEMLAEMGAWREELQRAGVFRTGLRLAPVDAATSLRREGGDVLVTDGPFACADLDEALAWARRCPIVRIGTVEVRPEFGAST